MRFLTRFPFIRARLANLFALYHDLPNNLPHSHLKPPKANQRLKRYLESKCTIQALLFFRVLLRKNQRTIDSYSLLYVLKSCIHKSFSFEGKQLHSFIIKFGFEPIIYLQTSLLNMYSATQNLIDAQLVFDHIPSKNIICWTSLISAYVDNQKPSKALQLFRLMQVWNLEPDHVTVTVALSACADLGALEMGEWIHAYIRRKDRLKMDLSLNNAFINMYSKCGVLRSARVLFDNMQEKDVTSWTSIIVGHALHGQAEEALKLFAEMKETRQLVRKNKRNGDCGNYLLVPNDVTFLGVLMACSHAGLVDEGKWHFRSMTADYGLKPRDSHFGCMVDLFCRAGLLREAYEFILKMPVLANEVVWRTLLGACNLFGNMELGAQVRNQLLCLEPFNVGDSVSMSNLYASQGMWDKKMIVRDQIKHRRSPGCSLIEVESEIFEFVASDDDHPLTAEIHEVIKSLIVTVKTYGHSIELLGINEY